MGHACLNNACIYLFLKYVLCTHVRVTCIYVNAVMPCSPVLYRFSHHVFIHTMSQQLRNVVGWVGWPLAVLLPVDKQSRERGRLVRSSPALATGPSPGNWPRQEERIKIQPTFAGRWSGAKRKATPQCRRPSKQLGSGLLLPVWTGFRNLPPWPPAPGY